jgi:glutathione S-transferase
LVFTITFYAIPASIYCAKTWICLRHKNLDWTELPPPGGFGSDVYTSYIPSGTLPGLSDGETTLGDSDAIAEYLEEAYPSFAMLPKPIAERAKIG